LPEISRLSWEAESCDAGGVGVSVLVKRGPECGAPRLVAPLFEPRDSAGTDAAGACAELTSKVCVTFRGAGFSEPACCIKLKLVWGAVATFMPALFSLPPLSPRENVKSDAGKPEPADDMVAELQIQGPPVLLPNPYPLAAQSPFFKKKRWRERATKF
jgi:hypothetical protein